MFTKASPLNRTAKVAGLSCLLSTAIVVYTNFGILSKLMVAGNPAQTAQNILSHESLFRLSIVGHMFYCAGILIFLSALYIILKRANEGLALAAALFRLVFALIWIFIVLNFFTALRLISNDYLKVIEMERLQALAKLFLSGYDAYYVGLLFWSLASTLCGWLWFRSKFVPAALGLFGFVSSAWCVFCTVVFLVYPDFDKIVNLWWFDSPMAVFEIVLSFWLLFKGIRAPGTE